ncbi:MAG: flagellar basal body L-ring protein FlgH [Gemmatimonadota bacterium]
MKRYIIPIIATSALLVSFAGSLGAQARPARGDSAARRTSPGSRSWTSDRRAFSVGDIIKVRVDEFAIAEANKDNLAAASRKRRLDLGADAETGSGSGSGVGPIQGRVETGDDSDWRQRGEASRGTRYLTEIPVRIVEVTADGLLRVQGKKIIDVDKNKQEMTLSGLIRPADISASDLAFSDEMADMQLTYASNGGLGKPKSGIFGKILGILWP